ncbi:hypothetical protein [Specibacter cremeus]|uniref:hypothetical protein n=1 Tax=Specibacter cremeus TaxID=1629051 RepID=UPI000F79F9FA|nr:hypothetical protein [Specibacter cremeus]
MSQEPTTRQQLSDLIASRRADLKAFLARTRPRRNRLAGLSIVGSTLAAAFTVGPGVGGTRFTEGVQNVFSLGSDSIVWRVLCLAAVVLSVVAALATSFANSRGIAAQVTAAEACNAELDGLETALAFGHMRIDDAVGLYRQYVAKVPFVDEAGGR